MLVQVPHIGYLIQECRRAETVQILTGHTLKSFTKTMDFIKNKPGGGIEICHIAPVRGKNSRGLLHYKNLFYGGWYQNRSFGSNYHSGGLRIERSQLVKKWAVDENMNNNTVLRKVEAFLGNVVERYIDATYLGKSKKRPYINEILKIDPDRDIAYLNHQRIKNLAELLAELRESGVSGCGSGSESKYIVYIDELTRFISYGGDRARTLRKLRTLMIAGYVALEKIKNSQTHNENFHEVYGSLIKPKYISAALQNSDEWSEFKDFIYKAAFIALQGGHIDIKNFRSEFKLYLKPLK